MSKSKRLAKLDKHECHEVNQSSDENTCNLKFSKCDDNKYQLWDLNKTELKKFTNTEKATTKANTYIVHVPNDSTSIFLFKYPAKRIIAEIVKKFDNK